MEHNNSYSDTEISDNLTASGANYIVSPMFQYAMNACRIKSSNNEDNNSYYPPPCSFGLPGACMNGF